MRWFLTLTLLFAVWSIVKAFPATKKGPPIRIVEEDVDDSRGPVPNGQAPLKRNDGHQQKRGPPIRIVEEDVDDPRGPVPNGPAPLKQDDGPHEKQDMIMDESEQDDMVIMKRRPDNDAAWPKSGSTVQIPYTTSEVDNDVLTRAIEVFNAKTCVRFVPRSSSEANYVHFQESSSRCSASVGYFNSGMQTVDLTSSCAGNKGKVMHEMMHVLGFLHEQCRPDRNSYITVHNDRINTGAVSNFAIDSDSVDQGLPYDCDSILHYRAQAFARVSGQHTITSSYCSHLGNGDTRLSLLDYKRVNTLYSCGKPEYKYYTVRVVTSSSYWSGTDCFIYLTLHGSSQTSTEFELDLSTDSSANLFERGSDDTFNYMAYRDDLGSISGISVRMVSNGNGEGWKPSRFTVTDPASGTSVTFTNSNWLYPSSTYGTGNFNVE